MSLASLNKLLVSLSLFACSSVFAAPLVVNVAGVQSYGLLGNANNTVLDFNVGANAVITSISYSVSLTATPPSWLSEMALYFGDSTGVTGVFFNPGFLDDVAGSATYADSFDLVALGLDFAVGADGILHLEFFEDFNDYAGVDGFWNAGTITFGIDTVDVEVPGEVPEPATGLLLGAGLAVMGFAGRRQAARRAAHLA